MKTIRRSAVALVLAAGIGVAVPSVASANPGFGAYRIPTFSQWWCAFQPSPVPFCVPGPTEGI
jgi:hypothetical protein